VTATGGIDAIMQFLADLADLAGIARPAASMLAPQWSSER
jgi:hypothetical protein